MSTIDYKLLVAGWDNIEKIINEIKNLPTYELEDGIILVERHKVGEILANYSDIQLAQYGNWIKITDKQLPNESGYYLVYLQANLELSKYVNELSYVTEMYFNKDQKIWIDEKESYNAILSAVDIKHAYHVTYWMERPAPPKEE